MGDLFRIFRPDFFILNICFNLILNCLDGKNLPSTENYANYQQVAFTRQENMRLVLTHSVHIFKNKPFLENTIYLFY